MDKPIKILKVFLITVFIFPVLAQAEFFVRKYVAHIPMPSFFLMFAIFLPIIFNNFTQKGLRDLAEVYFNTMRFTIPFFLVAVVAIAWGLHPNADWEGGFRNMAMDLFHCILLMLSITIAQSWAVKKYHRIIFLIVLAGAGAAVWVDHFNPGTFSNIAHRAAGFTTNANDGGRLIVLLCIAAVDWKKNELINLIVLTFSGMTVFVTLSVGSLALYLSVVAYYLYLHIKGGNDNFLKKLFLVVAVPLLVMFVIQPLLSDMRESSDSFDNQTAQKRLDKITSFFSGDFSSYAQEHDRKDLVDAYWESIFEAPVMGQGTGFSTTRRGSMGTHNMYLKHWVENGLLGLILYLFLLAGAFSHFYKYRDKRGMIFVFVFFWSGFLDHNLLHDKTVVVLLGFFGTLAYLNHPKPQEQQYTQNQLTPHWKAS